MLAICTYCTKSYAYALEAQAPLTIAALRYAGIKEATFILSGDDSAEVKTAFVMYAKLMAENGFQAQRVTLDVACNANADHAKESNLVIARMQWAAWCEAQKLGATMVWSLESDILPSIKALQVMLDTLHFDRGWYDVAMVTYPNEEFLGGRGTPRNWIAPNVYQNERLLSEDAQAKMDAAKDTPPSPEELKELGLVVESSPPKGNVHQLNGEGWRRRGWLTHAYPGVGRGCIVPTDWVGLGCTLIGKRALELANFTGFNGEGTQDLWLCWRVWHPEGIRMAVVTHTTCSHVKRKDGKETILYAYHELGGEFDGHLRSEKRLWDKM